MKAFKHSSIQAFLVFFLSLFFLTNSSGQWSPATLEENTHRLGKTQIGTSTLLPTGWLHIHKSVPKDAYTEPFPSKPSFPHISLSTYSELSQSGSIWSIDGGMGTLAFLRNGIDVLQMRPAGVNINGDNLTVGQDFRIGQNTVSPDGSNAHYLSFGLSPSTSGFGAGQTTGSLIQATPTGDMYFYSKSNPSGGITSATFDQYNRFTIKNDGKVGVGTLNPSQLLTISTKEDDPVFRLDNQKNNDWEIYTNNGLRFRGGTDGVGTDLLDKVVISEQGQVAINIASDLSDEKLRVKGAIRFVGTDDDGADQDNMVIATNGKVFVGLSPSATLPDITGSTQTYKMYVNGGVACKEVKVRTDWADYVFSKDYEILPLDKVETFIQANHHLPNMPSAEKVQEQGVELGNMTTKQQEKIEELFLHLIELEKRITQLEKENQSLKSKNK